MADSPPLQNSLSGSPCEMFGLGVSRGIAIGRVYRHDAETLTVAEYKIPQAELGTEKDRFRLAVDRTAQQINALQSKAQELNSGAAEELSCLLDAYVSMLHGSRLMRGVLARIDHQHINAEAAVQQEVEQIARGFEAMEDAYLAARVADIRDLGRRLVRNLTGTPYRPFQHLPRNAIILADELTPADTALLDPTHVAGIATVLGGAESHTAIMARSMGLPAVLGVQGLMRDARPGQTAIIDGKAGRVILSPTTDVLEEFRRRRAHFLRERRSLMRLRDLPTITQDGTRIHLLANIELPNETEAVISTGGEGIGLLRSEFQFMNREDVPSEDEQYQMLRDVIGGMQGRTVTVRTLDVGGDKLAPCLGIQSGPNPALGLRAVRLSLSRRDLFDAQIRACLRASAHGALRIMIPMVSTVEEMRAARDAIDEIIRDFRQRGLPMSDPPPPVGVMIEVPGAALAADALAWHADFFSIGTNDLTQYTLAIDRTDEAVAHLYNPLHPAVLRLIQFSTEAAMRARIPICICGEIAGDPRFSALLLGLGIRELSMSPINIPIVKQRIRSLNLMAATRRVRSIMDQSDISRIAQLLDGFNDEESHI